ncbi:CheR family methyltransferase [Spirulina subsalsa]|uniref:CheR family methyltransferase n=1 Tax=Spirulina subsalsa TaxID=54311 RepID=UPI0002FD49A0|nr:protein-glutamate O-methyltransferase CheR [Spirulina subsalsa]
MTHDKWQDINKLRLTSWKEPVELNESTFTILRDLIHEKSGLYYELNKREMLGDKLTPRLQECGLTSFLDYYYFLKYDPSAYEEWGHLMNALAVPETFFWREIDPIQTLVQIILPKWFALNSQDTFRIWSAACSTGEEPLTIAMALNEAGWFQKCNIQIFASDASSKAIRTAREGIYRERSFRVLSPLLKSKYFVEIVDPIRKDQKAWKIDELIHKRIKWSVANLMNVWEFSSLARANFIFCRNVFIYFSEQAIENTVNHFYDFMPSPGYLSISTSESLLKLKTPFQLKEIGGAFIYLKSKEQARSI